MVINAMVKQKDIMKNAKPYYGKTSRRGLQLERETAQRFYERAMTEKKNVFTLPLEDVNECLGFDSDKNKAPTLNKAIRKQHSDLIQDSTMEWHIGSGSEGKLYVIRLRKIKEEQS